MKILLTGANGCLGRALVEQLAAAGHEVTTLVRPAGQKPVLEGVETVEMDLSAPLELAQLPSHVDAVIHAAQSRLYKRFPDGAADMTRINISATVELASYALKAGASSFVYTSTGSIYKPSPVPISETGDLSTGNFYSNTKYASENLLKQFANEIGVTIFRLFYLYGPGQRDMLMSNLAARIGSGRPVTLYGADGLLLCPTFSQDAAQIVVRAVAQGLPGLYNLAGDQVVSLRELSNRIGHAVGRAPSFEVCEAPTPVPVLADISKLKIDLPDIRFRPIETGLAATFGEALV